MAEHGGFLSAHGSSLLRVRYRNNITSPALLQQAHRVSAMWRKDVGMVACRPSDSNVALQWLGTDANRGGVTSRLGGTGSAACQLRVAG